MTPERLKSIAIGALIVAIAAPMFIWGAQRQGSVVNTDITTYDQSAYIEYARTMATTNYHFVGGRARMPLYPFLMSLFYEAGMKDYDFFVVGKSVSIGIGFCVACAVFAIFLRGMNLRNATALALISAFTMLVFKAPFFQTEVLFYGLNLGLFAAMFAMLQRPRFKVAIAAGVIAGVAQLTKASILPGVSLCALCLGLLAIVEAFSGRRLPRAEMARRAGKPLACAAIFLCLFLLVVFPYIRKSKQVFGSYFYNVTTTFYLWYDSWPQVQAGTALGLKDQWEYPKLPADELPSFRKYMREHDSDVILKRIRDGYVYLWRITASSYGYADFVYFFAIASLGIAATNARRLLPGMRRPQNWVLAFFIAAYFFGYAFSHAWYVPIASGNRFVLALLFPFLYLIGRFLTYAEKEGMGIALGRWKIDAAILSPVSLLMLLAYFCAQFPLKIGTMYGGN